MPRDSAGNYTLPSGNPVVSGTTITSDWANTTMSDIGSEMTNSLSREGQGGMLAELTLIDGVIATPALAFSAELTLGMYRPSAGVLATVVSGLEEMLVSSDGVGVPNMPTSDAGLLSGTLWNNAGVVNIVP